MNETTIITGDNIQRFRLATIEQGLKLESLGMRHSRNSVANAAKQILTIAGKKAPANKLKLYEAFKQFRAEQK